MRYLSGKMRHLYPLVLLLGSVTLVGLGARPVSAQAPRWGIGAGLGEQGTVGASMRYRPGARLGYELGVGAYRYALEDDRSEETGWVPVLGGELVTYFSRRDLPSQHGIGLSVQVQEVLGALLGISYRYERYFADSRIGLHAELGMMLAPCWRKRTEAFFEDEMGRSADDLDYDFVPLLFKLGVQF